MSGAARVINRSWAIGSDPAAWPDLGRQNRLRALSSLAVVAPDPVWSGVYLAYHEPAAAIVPLLYTPLALANLAAFSRTRQLQWAVAGQSLIILFLPFLVHVALGGFQPSSGVVLWSVLAPFAGLVFGGIRTGLAWLAAFAGIVVLAALVQPRVANYLPDWLVTVFFAANLATFSGVEFVF